MRLGGPLMGYLDVHPLGDVHVAPFDVVFSRFDVFEPDLLFISKDRSSTVTRKILLGAPDLAVEVPSEGTAHIDRDAKLKLCSRFGVRAY